MSAASPTKPAAPATPAKATAAKEAGRHRVHVLELDGKAGESLLLPSIFSVPLRPDLVRRAVISAEANRRQGYGPSRKAGMRHSVMWSGKGHGVSRTPRLMDSNRGAQAPNTVGGRGAHPPKPDAIYSKKLNTKERRRALAAALAATRETRFALERGHDVPDHLHLPVVLVDKAEEVNTAAQAREILEAIGLWDDVERASRGVHVRAGRGKLRGRVRRHPRSFLFVVSHPGKARGFRNFPGVDVIPIASLGTEHLAPGGDAGRLTLFTPASLKALETHFGGESHSTHAPAPHTAPSHGGRAA